MGMTRTTHRSTAAIVFATALLTGLVACGDDDSATSTTAGATATTAASTPTTTRRRRLRRRPRWQRPTAAPTTAAPTTAPTAGSPQPASAALQARLDALVAAGVPGVVALSGNGDVTEIGVAGVGDLATGEPVTPDTVFRTGSVAKTFVATVMLQLSAEGTLTLEDTVEQWLPGLVPNGAAITIRQLLGNRSGLFDFIEDPQVLAPYLAGDLGHVWTSEELVAVSNAHAPNFAPGTAALYSNTDYTLAGMIIEQATGSTVAEEVAARIAGPLRLEHTTMPADSRPAGAVRPRVRRRSRHAGRDRDQPVAVIVRRQPRLDRRRPGDVLRRPLRWPARCRRSCWRRWRRRRRRRSARCSASGCR